MRELKTMVIESQHSISFRTSILGQRKKIKLLYRFSGKRYGNYCSHIIWRSLWLRLYGSWIYNYLCNLWLSPLTLWVRILLRRCVLDTTLCDKVCQWLAAGLWFFFVYSVSSTNKTNRHDKTEIVLKVALNNITIPKQNILSNFVR
jgi:hypothetical protein